MTSIASPLQLSSVDCDFVERLHKLQHSELTKALDVTARDVIVTPVYQSAIEEELERRRKQWDFDGAVILGRIDTATRRLYVGTRRVLDGGEPVLYSIDEPEVAEFAAASATNPGQVLLKRQLRVDGWTITESTTEFDLRAGHDAGDPPLREDGHGVARLVTELETLQSSVLALLRQALDLVDEGHGAPAQAPLAIADWNDRLADAARVAKLDPATASLTALREQAARNERQRRHEAERILENVLRDHPELADVLRDMVDLPNDSPQVTLDRQPTVCFRSSASQAAPSLPPGFDAGKDPWL
jgi:hypothetical protein